jgi:hypothetical protein
MNARLQRRLEQIAPRIVRPDFLQREGIGNEIACHIFDYPPEDELQVREHIEALGAQLSSNHRSLSWCHINLLDVLTGYLQSRKLLDSALKMQQKKGDQGVIRALAGPLAAEKISTYIATTHQPAQHDLILLSGVGSVWPVIRMHSLLNCLHKDLDGTPAVIFYPGSFDGTTLQLFNRADTRDDARAAAVSARPYYRAFTLVSEEV